MARTNFVLILVVSLLVMISVAESKRLAGKKQAPPALVCNAVYGAEEGDTCTLVAEMFNLTLDSFLALNPNINCDSFFVGQWLCTDGAQQ